MPSVRIWSCLWYILDYFVLWILTLYYFEHNNTLLLFYIMSMLNNCDWCMKRKFVYIYKCIDFSTLRISMYNHIMSPVINMDTTKIPAPMLDPQAIQLLIIMCAMVAGISVKSTENPKMLKSADNIKLKWTHCTCNCNLMGQLWLSTNCMCSRADQAEVIMFVIPCIILFKISCNFLHYICCKSMHYSQDNCQNNPLYNYIS